MGEREGEVEGKRGARRWRTVLSASRSIMVETSTLATFSLPPCISRRRSSIACTFENELREFAA